MPLLTLHRKAKPDQVLACRILGLRIWLILLLIALSSGSKSFAEENKTPRSRSNIHWYWTGAGLAIMAGGGAFAYFQNRASDRDMAIYRNSAFTENTTVYRERVRRHDRWAWTGIGGMVLGGLVMGISF